MMFLNQIKNLQVLLTDFGLYKGPIDGKFGKGSVDGFNKLFNNDVVELDVITKLDNKETIDYLECRVPSNKDISELSFLDKINYLSNNGFEVFGLKQTYQCCWSKKVGIDFTKKINDWVIKNNLNSNAVDWVMAIINFESGGTFSPSIQNKAGANAFGLIQFMAPAAKDLNTTLEDLVKMSALEQLDYVFKYFERWNLKKLLRLEDFYFSVLYPKAIGWDLERPLFVEGSKEYKYNKGLDLNKDGIITVAEINSIIYKSYYDGMCYLNRKEI